MAASFWVSGSFLLLLGCLVGEKASSAFFNQAARLGVLVLQLTGSFSTSLIFFSLQRSFFFEHISGLADMGWKFSAYFSGFDLLQQAFIISGTITSLAFLHLLLTRPASFLRVALPALGIVILAGVVLLSTSSLFSLLISFETLLLTSLFLLRLTSKSERVLEAVLEMLLWTLVGSVCLLLSFGILLSQGILDLFCLAHCSQLDTFVGILLITGFGVKIPVWPFFSWLLKAHVEASVEFSILLSGLIVKLGIFALARFLPFMAGGPALLLLVSLTLISISEATFRLFAQRDLKRIVALTTIIEMNWLTLCLAIGTAPFLHAAALIAVAHSFSTISEFFLVECISRRFNSRDSAAISSLATQAPLLWACSLVTTLITIGFPGTSIFLAKLLFFLPLLETSLVLFVACFLLFFLVLPLFFFRLWVPIWFGSTHPTSFVNELTLRELGLLAIAILGGITLGIWPSLLLPALV